MKPKPKTAPPAEPLPILLTRKQWENVRRCLKTTIGVTPQKIQHVDASLQEPGDPIIISISPDGAKWLAREVMRGKEIGDEIYRQWHFWQFCVPRIEKYGRSVTLDCYCELP